MKWILKLVASGIFLLLPAVADETRNWILSGGSRIDARLVFAGNEEVVLKTINDRLINVRRDQLSQVDRQ